MRIGIVTQGLKAPLLCRIVLSKCVLAYTPSAARPARPFSSRCNGRQIPTFGRTREFWDWRLRYSGEGRTGV